MEFDALLVGLAPAGGADSGGFFVEGGAVFVEQDLLLLELCREEEVFRQPPQEFNALTQSRKQGRKGLGGRFQCFQPAADGEERAAKVVKNVEHTIVYQIVRKKGRADRMIRVLLVEDDPVIRDTTCYFLKSQQNFEVVCAETGGDALSHAREKFDVILMDILLPDTNGVDLCQRLRSWHHCPIIFTSCLDDTDTIVRALEMGGDDFLAKPYNNKILLARIMANIRRVQMDGAEPSVNGYHCTAFTLDANSHSVEKDGRSVHLADMEYRILTLFVRYPNTFFTANELYQKIWGKESLGDVRTVQVHIHNLRSKIEPDPAKPVYLKNIWGKGYVFQPDGGKV